MYSSFQGCDWGKCPIDYGKFQILSSFLCFDNNFPLFVEIGEGWLSNKSSSTLKMYAKEHVGRLFYLQFWFLQDHFRIQFFTHCPPFIDIESLPSTRFFSRRFVRCISICSFYQLSRITSIYPIIHIFLISMYIVQGNIIGFRHLLNLLLYTTREMNITRILQLYLCAAIILWFLTGHFDHSCLFRWAGFVLKK